MAAIVLGREEYRDKVQGCWLGKNVGGTLGGPWEGPRHTHALTFYEPVPDKAAANDDLDLQLVWLHMLENEGTDPSIATFADYWAKYACRYPWNEYGFFMRNYARGLRPPVAGCFENYFVDEMGSPIRSEIWACLHPADPQAAAAMAWKDSAIDHSGGEGMYGEMFWAAVESAAFVERDPLALIRIGLGMVPLSSHVARSIREAMWCRANNLTWGQARERIASRFGTLQPCNAVPNHGFTIIGWLYGADFGDCLCKAVNCGYDTDCTGATLGSVLGIIGGAKSIPEKWLKPVGDQIVLHRFTGPCNPPATISELTDRTVTLAEKVHQDLDTITFGKVTAIPTDILSRLSRSTLARQALSQDIHAGTAMAGTREIRLHYNGEPVLRPGIAREIHIEAVGAPDAVMQLDVPDGWECRKLGDNRFSLLCSGEIAPRNTLAVGVDGKRVTFTMLGPGEAVGFPAGDNVPVCPKCWARVEACVCKRG